MNMALEAEDTLSIRFDSEEVYKIVGGHIVVTKEVGKIPNSLEIIYNSHTIYLLQDKKVEVNLLTETVDALQLLPEAMTAMGGTDGESS